MSARPDGAFADCLRFANEQARLWVPHWLSQLNAALQHQEGASRSFNEKQAHGLSRTVLTKHRDTVAARFIAELDALIQNADTSDTPATGARKPAALSLDDLELVDHVQVQEKVDLERTKQIVRMRAEASLAGLNARLSRAWGLEVVRSDVNPLQPEAIVSALARALASLHLDQGVRAQWLQAGAVPLGVELEGLYGAMAHQLALRGIEPAGYLVVNQSELGKPAIASQPAVGEREVNESAPLENLPGAGPKLTLDHLHELLAGNLKDAGPGRSPAAASGIAYPLAAEVVTVMLRRVAEDGGLLQPLRDMVQGLRPALMQLAQSDPGFFADRANPARRLLEAISGEGSAFASEQDQGFAEFAERTRRVVGALSLAEGELPARLLASLQRFRSTTGSPAAQTAGTVEHLACGSSEERSDFVDTQPMEHEAGRGVRGSTEASSGASPAWR